MPEDLESIVEEVSQRIEACVEATLGAYADLGNRINYDAQGNALLEDVLIGAAYKAFGNVEFNVTLLPNQPAA